MKLLKVTIDATLLLISLGLVTGGVWLAHVSDVIPAEAILSIGIGFTELLFVGLFGLGLGIIGRRNSPTCQ